jgi:hypothetical protein
MGAKQRLIACIFRNEVALPTELTAMIRILQLHMLIFRVLNLHIFLLYTKYVSL